ncbi:MAG: hypothetical protein EOM54_12730 [Clostridia bacterium]|nr:hypothetical protein [Clostridia bacterium]
MKHQKEIEWSRLDNASKIFPATWSSKDPKVFRLSCELFEAVEQDVLQIALDMTIDNFPLCKSVLRKGVFWYYLESSGIRPEVLLEEDPICAPIYIGLKSNLLFRVSYYKNRINLEMFHALSDGAGAIWFIKTLVYHYLTLLRNEPHAGAVFSSEFSSISEQMDDSFKKNYVGGNAFRKMNEEIKKQSKINACQIRGTRTAENRITLIEGAMSAEAVLKEAHLYHTTLTVFIASLLICAIHKEMPARRKDLPIVLTVPVNLRPFFASATARNFFGSINVGYKFEKDTDDLKAVIDGIGESFKKNLTAEQLNCQLNKYMDLELNSFARVIPLPLKDLIIRIAAKIYDRHTTSNVSNIGRIVMPPELNPDIRQFSVYTSARRPQITLCSYNDRLVIGFTSPFKETDIQRTFFQMLSKMGIDSDISSNL